MAKDPVCGMAVDGQRTAVKVEHRGETYHFCSPGCKEAFNKDPAQYIDVHVGVGHTDHH